MNSKIISFEEGHSLIEQVLESDPSGIVHTMMEAYLMHVEPKTYQVRVHEDKDYRRNMSVIDLVGKVDDIEVILRMNEPRVTIPLSSRKISVVYTPGGKMVNVGAFIRSEENEDKKKIEKGYKIAENIAENIRELIAKVEEAVQE
ncbi:MAG: hypothetical protein GOU97_04370 [Nanoarchaeota archaeon]|nr:hypothetical protein [Nanoarchaeota archaeon]